MENGDRKIALAYFSQDEWKEYSAPDLVNEMMKETGRDAIVHILYSILSSPLEDNFLTLE